MSRPRKSLPVLPALEPAELVGLVEAARAAVRVLTPATCGDCARATCCASLGRCLRGVSSPASWAQILSGRCSLYEGRSA